MNSILAYVLWFPCSGHEMACMGLAIWSSSSESSRAVVTTRRLLTRLCYSLLTYCWLSKKVYVNWSIWYKVIIVKTAPCEQLSFRRNKKWSNAENTSKYFLSNLLKWCLSKQHKLNNTSHSSNVVSVRSSWLHCQDM